MILLPGIAPAPNNPPVLPAKQNLYAVKQQLTCFLAGRDVPPSSTAKPFSSHAKLKPSAKPDSQLLIVAGVQKAENLASTKLMPVAPAEMNDSRSRLLIEHHSRKKDGPVCPIRLDLEHQLKPQEASRTTVRSIKQSHSQGCSPSRELRSQVICVSSLNISKVMSPQLSITASKEGPRDSCGLRGRQGVNSCIHASTSTPLRSAALLNDLIWVCDHLAFSAPSPSMNLEQRHLQITLEKTVMSCKASQNFFCPPCSSLRHKCTRKELELTSFHLYPASSNLNLNVLTSLFSSHYLSSSLNFLAYPLCSELIHSSPAFRSCGIPGDKSSQMSSRQFSRPPNSPMLPRQASSSKGNIAVGCANSMAVSSSTPNGRFPSCPKSGPPLVGDVFQGSWLFSS